MNSLKPWNVPEPKLKSPQPFFFLQWILKHWNENSKATLTVRISWKWISVLMIPFWRIDGSVSMTRSANLTLYTAIETAGITMKKTTKTVMCLRSESGSPSRGFDSSRFFRRSELSVAGERFSRLLAIEYLTETTSTQRDMSVWAYRRTENRPKTELNKPNEKPNRC